ncbi:hypothetical protein AWU65_11275 [Paenibacillus glucanolyticus]|uniref:Uncharacterized protein n=1 Tax=Paenibacillus glucanolyticus TaxID=59843 RepID=A0A163J9R5_9BACL|nr:hypothetical protein [Paenibacillus glucanolyticus]KZS46454.1 hypothetical protein AWU65_11275 [Paenibacillus glucanolyticus]
MDKTLFSGRVQELQTELNKLHSEKFRIELELTDGNTSPVSFEQVRELIHGFNLLLTAAPFEQRKTLMPFSSNELR